MCAEYGVVLQHGAAAAVANPGAEGYPGAGRAGSHAGVFRQCTHEDYFEAVVHREQELYCQHMVIEVSDPTPTRRVC